MSLYAHVTDKNLRAILEAEVLEFTPNEMKEAVEYSRLATANDADDMRLSEATYWRRLSCVHRAEKALAGGTLLEVQEALQALWG